MRRLLLCAALPLVFVLNSAPLFAQVNRSAEDRISQERADRARRAVEAERGSQDYSDKKGKGKAKGAEKGKSAEKGNKK